MRRKIGMSMRFMTAAAVAAGGMCASVVLATPAVAEPVEDPCGLAVTLLCRFAPIAPSLDHDVDLTQDSAVVNGQQLPRTPEAPEGAVEERIPPDPCATGCI